VDSVVTGVTRAALQAATLVTVAIAAGIGVAA